MSDEYMNENETLEGSETSENNVISESESQQDLSSDVPLEDDVRKFQSMYDKAQAELDKVKPVAKLFQDNPELVDVVRNHLTGGKGQDKEIKINEEEFNPWDAYTNPNSKSYALRQQEIDEAVSSRMSDYMGRLEAQRQVDSLRMRAQSEFKLSNNDAEEFVEFVTKPKDQLPLDTLFNVWNTNKNGLPQLNQNIESVKRTQQRPKSAGLVQGGQPPKKSDEDNMWSNIMKAGNPNSIRGNIKK